MKSDFNSKKIYFKNHKFWITRQQIYNAILDQGIHFGNVEAILLFGSCLKNTRKTIQNNIFGFKFDRRIYIAPNDLDVGVFVKKLDKNIKSELRKNLEIMEPRRWGQANYSSFSYHVKHNFLHLLITTKRRWSKAFLDDKSDAKSMIDGMLIYGELDLEGTAFNLIKKEIRRLNYV